MYRPECRERGHGAWEHDQDCVEGLKQRVRWYEMALAAALGMLVVNAAVFWALFVFGGN